MKFKVLFVIIFFQCNSFLYSQDRTIDSILMLIKYSQADTSKVNYYYLLAKKVQYSDVDSSIVFSNCALDIINASNNIPEFWKLTNKGRCLHQLALSQNNKGNYPKALDLYFKALAIWDKLEGLGEQNQKFQVLILKSKTLGNIGIVYDEEGNYKKALEYYFKALKMDEALNRKSGIATKLGNIGIVFKEQASVMARNKGNIFKVDSLYQKALDYYFKALKLDDELGNENNMSIWLGNIGVVYDEQRKFQQALIYYFKALKLAEKIGDKNRIAVNLGNIGSSYNDQKEYKKAFDYLYRAVELSYSMGAMYDMKYWYEELSALYEESDIQLLDTLGGKLLNREQMRQRSLHYYKIYIALRDTLSSMENKEQMVQREMNYEFDKKEAITKAENDKQIAIAAAENKKQKIVIWFVVSGLVLLMLFAIIIFRSLHITRAQKRIIEEQKNRVDEANEELNMQNEEIAAQRDEIESQRDMVTLQKNQIEKIHHEVSDSINYATRIQKAILPDFVTLQPYLADCFVLFKPKDKVSGDFYWWAVINNHLVLTVADCTGHGVPGAFMSLLGTSFLRELVVKENITDPSLILKRLRLEIIQILKQSGDYSGQKDGMDMALVVINLDSLEMQFAGANNPVYIIKQKNGKVTASLTEIKPDKMPVAIYEKMGPFTNQSYPLQKGDVIYLLSDGYQDQFGGDKYKKFMSNHLKELLLEIHKKPMNEQKEILNRTIEEWMNGRQQIDDITVMGIKI